MEAEWEDRTRGDATWARATGGGARSRLEVFDSGPVDIRARNES